MHKSTRKATCYLTRRFKLCVMVVCISLSFTACAPQSAPLAPKSQATLAIEDVLQAQASYYGGHIPLDDLVAQSTKAMSFAPFDQFRNMTFPDTESSWFLDPDATDEFLDPSLNRALGIQISSDYGKRKAGKGSRFHQGVDIRAPRGSEVFALQQGTVTRASRYNAYGNCIEVTHPDGKMTRYAHLDKILVQNGQKVEAGALVGLVGKTGRATGYHLHFEVWMGKKNQDPKQYFTHLNQLVRSTNTELAQK